MKLFSVNSSRTSTQSPQLLHYQVAWMFILSLLIIYVFTSNHRYQNLPDIHPKEITSKEQDGQLTSRTEHIEMTVEREEPRNEPAWRKFLLDHFNTTHFNCTEDAANVEGKRLSWETVSRLLASGPRANCFCESLFRPALLDRPEQRIFYSSTCGPDADVLGQGQNVISFSLFRPKGMGSINRVSMLENGYTKGIKKNLLAMKRLYPGWVMRVYTDVDLDGEMCDLVCHDEDLYFCPVSNINLPKISQTFPMIWRFIVLGDVTVKKFAVRDLDSLLSDRERTAVKEWEKSQFPFHAMRDHRYHVTKIMGGMWGGDNSKVCYVNGQRIIQKIINAKLQARQIKGYDQLVLSHVIHTNYKSSILQHDSYLCEHYRDSLPFPSQRLETLEYVGEPISELEKHPEARIKSLKVPCPPLCRPKYGLNWTYC